MTEANSSIEEPTSGKVAMLTRAFLIIVGLILLAIVFVSLLFPVVKSGERASKTQRCRNQVRNLALPLILYANDTDAFPHMAGKDEYQSAEDVSDAFRSLIRMSYVADSSMFICPESRDQVAPGASSFIVDPELWDWRQRKYKGSNALDRKSSHLSVFDNTELSYTLRKRRLMSNKARSDTIIIADKWMKPLDKKGFTIPGSRTGNHGWGSNVGFADGHVSMFKHTDRPKFKKLFRDLRMKTERYEDIAPK
ncbi:MAG: hypothetical protein P1V97_15955 [Planctomycetota bacterium]|nr:hypothetical protein [Planctomycetota bacterium]